MDIGEKIIYLRTKENMSQAKLAEMIFVSRQAISRWENGHTHPELDTVKLLAKLFDYPLEWFLSDEYELSYLESIQTVDSSSIDNLTSVTEKQVVILSDIHDSHFKKAILHLKVNKWIAVSSIVIALFPGFFFPRLLVLTIPVAILALYTNYSRILIGVLLSLTTVLTLLELLSLLTIYFNWYVQSDIQEVINFITVHFN